ncbi:MAG: hypothetical protein KDC75_20080, partial [Phaeodactylibacter sp.]|nr:hypothetical protein [Phaeodactylibacter sp.]
PVRLVAGGGISWFWFVVCQWGAKVIIRKLNLSARFAVNLLFFVKLQAFYVCAILSTSMNKLWNLFFLILPMPGCG